MLDPIDYYFFFIYRLMETNKYYVVEEDVSDEEDIDTKQYESPGYQR